MKCMHTRLGTTEEKPDESAEQKTEGEQEVPASTEGCLQ